MSKFTYDAEIIEIIDGDTMDLRVDLGFHVSKDIRVRLIGVDTHETYGVDKNSEEYQRGAKETEFVQEWIDTLNGEVIIKTQQDEKGKYGRWLARIFGNGKCLNEVLLEEFDGVEPE